MHVKQLLLVTGIALICFTLLPTDTLGVYAVIYTATDASGNKAEFRLTVNVVEATPPLLKLLGPIVLEWRAGDAWIDPGATADDLVDGTLDSHVVVSYEERFSTHMPATYTVTYTLNYTNTRGLKAQPVMRSVVVKDLDPPVRRLFYSTTSRRHSVALVVPFNSFAHSPMRRD